MNINLHVHVNEVNVDADGHRRHRRRLSLKKIGPFSEQWLPKGPEGEHMIAELTATQQIDVTYGKPVDKKGNETTVQPGSVVWKSDNEAVATVTPGAEDPISGTIVAGAPGTCEVWPEADADLGDGVVTIQGEKIGVHVTAGQATGFGSPTLGTPVEQP